MGFLNQYVIVLSCDILELESLSLPLLLTRELSQCIMNNFLSGERGERGVLCDLNWKEPKMHCDFHQPSCGLQEDSIPSSKGMKDAVPSSAGDVQEGTLRSPSGISCDDCFLLSPSL